MKLPIRKELFWDVDVNTLDEQTHKRYIIQQVLNFGNLEEFRALLRWYGQDMVREEAKKAGYLDPKTLAFVTSHFNINKNEMQCCIKKRSRPVHWS